jgi:hypothetical protein
MLKETIALETLRQKIENAEFTAGDRSDYIDYGRPNASELKAAQETIAKKMSEAAELKKELHTLIGQSPKQAMEEWVNWHKNVLQGILLESATNLQGKTRVTTARKTLTEWDKVLTGEQEYVSINWHFLKDYKAKAEKEFKNNWWNFWK